MMAESENKQQHEAAKAKEAALTTQPTTKEFQTNDTFFRMLIHTKAEEFAIEGNI